MHVIIGKNDETVEQNSEGHFEACKIYGSRGKHVGKPDTEWLVHERIVTSIFEKSSGSLNCFSFHTGPGMNAKSTNLSLPF